MKTPHVYTLALIGIKAIHSGETRPQSRLLVSLITYTFSVMSSLDEELLMDAEEDARIVAHIQQVLPQELKEKFTEDDLYTSSTYSLNTTSTVAHSMLRPTTRATWK